MFSSGLEITCGENGYDKYGDRYLHKGYKSHEVGTSCLRAIHVLQSRHHTSSGENPKKSSHAPKSFLRQSIPSERAHCHFDRPTLDSSTPLIEEAHFASRGSYGVVDLGASKTVIGSESLQELMMSLPTAVLKLCYRTPCVIHFRFGNQRILTSEWAFVVPLSKTLHLKIAVVKGSTPFLLSAFLRTIGAVIDTSKDVL